MPPPNQEPLVYGFEVVKEYQHDSSAYTQGLLWQNGVLYESTGLYGQSSVREVKLQDDGGYQVVRRKSVPSQYFAEGLTYHNGELFQIMWQVGTGFKYTATPGEGGSLEKSGNFETGLGDGWGLTSNSSTFFATTSTGVVFHLDPDTFELKKQVQVNDDGRKIVMVNEMELIDDELWGNIYEKDCIARFSPDSGSVSAWVILSDILNQIAREARTGTSSPGVLNGIAWDPETKRLWVTGKKWPKLFEIKLVPRTDLTLDEVRSLCIPTRNLFR